MSFAEELRSSIEIQLRESPRVGGVSKELFDLIEVAEVRHQVDGLAKTEGINTLGLIAVSPVHVGEEPLQIVRQLVHLELQVDVAEQLVGELL